MYLLSQNQKYDKNARIDTPPKGSKPNITNYQNFKYDNCLILSTINL